MAGTSPNHSLFMPFSLQHRCEIGEIGAGEAKDAVSYFETTWHSFPEGELEDQGLLPETAEGRWLFQASSAAFVGLVSSRMTL